MAASTWKLALAPFAWMALATPLLVDCGGAAPPPAAPPTPKAKAEVTTCEELAADKLAEVPVAATPEAEGRIRALLAEARRLILASKAAEAELIEACRVIGKSAGAFDEELKGLPDGGRGAQRVCAVAAEKVGKVLDAAKAAKVTLVVDYDKALCFTDVEAQKKCFSECGSTIKGDDRANCTGGELYGTCKGRCGAACANEPGEGSGACWGVCSGKCDKEFRGVCNGKCSGTCNGAPTRGKTTCVGICDGTCSDKSEGICGGRCDGACSGVWEPRDSSKCTGICTGPCAGQAGAPVCTGEYAPKGVEAICQARCSAHSAAAMWCTAPQVRITAKGGKQTAELQRLLVGLQTGLPRLLRVQEGTSRRLPRAIDAVSTACIEWSNAYATSGAKALACVRAGLDGIKDGAKAIDVAVKGADAFRPLLKPLLKPTEPPPPAPDP